MGTDVTDEQLMLSFRAGDPRAFEQLVSRHRAPVFNFVLRLTGNRAKAEDVLQDVWLKVVRGAQEWQPKARFTTWVYTIARNLCVDTARKESYRKADSLDAPGGADGEGRALSDQLADGGHSPERGAHNHRLRPLIERALAALPQEQREVFLLREYSGITFQEISEVTGVPLNTVKSRMRYALEGLRKALTELGVDGDLADDGRTAVG